MTAPASVAGDERLRLFLALRLPDAVLDTIESWQASRLGGLLGSSKGGLRVVSREHLHVTLAFLGHRPAGELEGVVGALREAAAGAGSDLRLAPSGYRETRSVAMVLLEDLS